MLGIKKKKKNVERKVGGVCTVQQGASDSKSLAGVSPHSMMKKLREFGEIFYREKKKGEDSMPINEINNSSNPKVALDGAELTRG